MSLMQHNLIGLWNKNGMEQEWNRPFTRLRRFPLCGERWSGKGGKTGNAIQDIIACSTYKKILL